HGVGTRRTSAGGFSEVLLEDESLKPGERKRFVNTIHDESLRLTKLLDQILDLSAMERGERGWENTPIDAEAALDRAIEVCRGLARQLHMRIELGARSEGATVGCLSDRICQVRINLFSIAIN